jgi:hypothetical protein
MIRYARIVLFSAISLSASFGFAANFPTGTFTGGQDTVRFDANGHFHVAAGKDNSVDGTYKTQGSEITFTDVSGTMACAKDMASGKYKWSYADNAIAFTKVDDACSDRSGDLTAQPWRKQ